jgi:hypothetical protein
MRSGSGLAPAKSATHSALKSLRVPVAAIEGTLSGTVPNLAGVQLANRA